MTHHVGPNLPVTTQQRLRFSTWASYRNRTFVSMSMGGLDQCDVSPCILRNDHWFRSGMIDRKFGNRLTNNGCVKFVPERFASQNV